MKLTPERYTAARVHLHSENSLWRTSMGRWKTTRGKVKRSRITGNRPEKHGRKQFTACSRGAGHAAGRRRISRQSCRPVSGSQAANRDAVKCSAGDKSLLPEQNPSAADRRKVGQQAVRIRPGRLIDRSPPLGFSAATPTDMLVSVRPTLVRESNP